MTDSKFPDFCGRLYPVWLVALVVLYYACPWHSGIKRWYRYAWLSYL